MSLVSEVSPGGRSWRIYGCYFESCAQPLLEATGTQCGIAFDANVMLDTSLPSSAGLLAITVTNSTVHCVPMLEPLPAEYWLGLNTTSSVDPPTVSTSPSMPTPLPVPTPMPRPMPTPMPRPTAPFVPLPLPSHTTCLEPRTCATAVARLNFLRWHLCSSLSMR